MEEKPVSKSIPQKFIAESNQDIVMLLVTLKLKMAVSNTFMLHAAVLSITAFVHQHKI